MVDGVVSFISFTGEILWLWFTFLVNSQECDRIKTQYGIKCQAYNIIDTVNNDYLLNNQRLQAENELLKQEKVTLKKEIEDLKIKNVHLLMRSFQKEKNENYKQFVDLTAEDDDDEVEIVEKSEEVKGTIIEINDDDDEEDEEGREVNKQDMPEITKCDDDANDLNEASEEKNVKQFQEIIDYPSFENFIMSQI